MKPLESRKQLLIAESDLNRIHLLADVADVSASLQSITHRVRSFEGIASSATALVAALAAFHLGKGAGIKHRHPILGSLVGAAGFISSLWLTWRSRQSHPGSPRH